MGGSSQHVCAHGDGDHGFGHVDSGLAVAHEATPSDHLAEAALDDPAAYRDLETCMVIGSPDDLDGEMQIGGLVNELEPAV